MSRQVRRLDEAEATVAGTVLGRAFLDEPIMLAAMPNADERGRFCPLLFTINQRHACRYGEALAVEDEGGIVAAAYWVARPEPAIDEEVAEEIGAAALSDAWGTVLARLGAIEAEASASLAAIPPPWRYLGAIGVAPERQGEGIGAALLARILADAETAGEPIALVTDRERNLAFYERAGMILAAAGESSDGGVPWWTFRSPVAPVSAPPRS